MTNRIPVNVQDIQTNVNKTKTSVDNLQGSVNNPEILKTQNEMNTLSTVKSDHDGLSAEKAKEVTESLNKVLETTSTKLRYQYHEDLDKYYVILMDSKTEEVIREIPNKKLMDIYAAMLDFVGILVDEKI